MTEKERIEQILNQYTGTEIASLDFAKLNDEILLTLDSPKKAFRVRANGNRLYVEFSNGQSVGARAITL